MVADAYRTSGVDLDLMGGLKERIKAFAAMTHGPEVLDAKGSFAGVYQLAGFQRPALVASTDGVGTKLKVAAQLGHYESVGQDLVTLNVNDVITKGATPLFFLDYLAFSKLDEQKIETLMRGIIWGCKETGCALIGGETAQLPGMYSEEDIELAGFVVGAVERDGVIDGSAIQPGDVLLGIPSNGVHTNGFSLVRQVFNIDGDPSVLYRRFDELKHHLGEELLKRHRSYYPLLRPAFRATKGLAHITGGGIPGKLPSILPEQVAALIQGNSWKVPPVFDLIQRVGGVSAEEMYRVFNMGLGMIAVCGPAQVGPFRDVVQDAVIVGRIVPREGDEQVIFADNQ